MIIGCWLKIPDILIFRLMLRKEYAAESYMKTAIFRPTFPRYFFKLNTVLSY